MSKYDALTAHLQRQLTDEITLSFEEMEDDDIVGIVLPPSARAHRQWWENQSEPDNRQCASWLDVGWEVVDANLTTERVTFRRTGR